MSHGQREERVLDLAVALRQAVLSQRQSKTFLDKTLDNAKVMCVDKANIERQENVIQARAQLAVDTKRARDILDDLVEAAEWVDRTPKSHAQINVASDPSMRLAQIQAHPSVMSVKYWAGAAVGKEDRHYIKIRGEGARDQATMDLYMLNDGSIILWHKQDMLHVRSPATQANLDAFLATFPVTVKN